MKISRIKKEIFTFIGIVSLFLFVILVKKLYNLNEEAFEEDLPTTYKMTKEDSSLIPAQYYHRLRTTRVLNTKFRSHITELNFDKKYAIFIYKLDSLGQISLSDSINLTNANVSQSNLISYSVIDVSYYTFKFKAGRDIKNPSRIFLTFSGDSIPQSVITDSIISYNFRLSSMSIKYREQAPVDILIEGKSDGFSKLNISTNVLFLKKNRSTYFLMMTSDDTKISLPFNALYLIATGKYL